MDVLSPFISVLSHSSSLFHEKFCLRLDVVLQAVRVHMSAAGNSIVFFQYLFLQTTPLFPHGTVRIAMHLCCKTQQL